MSAPKEAKVSSVPIVSRGGMRSTHVDGTDIKVQWDTLTFDHCIEAGRNGLARATYPPGLIISISLTNRIIPDNELIARFADDGNGNKPPKTTTAAVSAAAARPVTAPTKPKSASNVASQSRLLNKAPSAAAAPKKAQTKPAAPSSSAAAAATTPPIVFTQDPVVGEGTHKIGTSTLTQKGKGAKAISVSGGGKVVLL